MNKKILLVSLLILLLAVAAVSCEKGESKADSQGSLGAANLGSPAENTIAIAFSNDTQGEIAPCG